MDIALVLQAVSTLCFFLIVFNVQGFKKTMEKMQESIGSLNTNIATLIEKDSNKDQRLDEQKERIIILEKEIDKLRERYHDNVNNLGARVQLVELDAENIKKNLEEINSKRHK